MAITKKKSYFSAGIITAIFLLFCFIPAAAQATDITELAWEKTDIGNVTSVAVNEAGSLVYAAASNNGTDSIICYNAAGSLQWSQPLTGSITTIKTTQSGGYLLAITGMGDNKSYLYNSAGSLQWSKTHTETPVDCDIDISGSKLAIITENYFYGYDIAGDAIGTYPAGVGTWQQVEIDPDFVILSKNVNTTITKYQFNSSEAWPNELHTCFGFAGWDNRIPITTTNSGNFSINITNVTGHADGDVFLPESYTHDLSDIRFGYDNTTELQYEDITSTFDPEEWAQATSSASWLTRRSHTSVVFDNKIWVMGGFRGTMLNDVWYSSDGITWTQATSSAGWTARAGHTSVVFDNKMWVIGGGTYDVWYSSDGVTWVQATSSAGWTVRNGHASVVFDNKMWVIGGGTNDVWYSSDGATWTEATSSAGWTGRQYFPAVVFDNKIWVMGGYASPYLNDVWYSSDGITWTEATSSAGWSARYAHSGVVFDNKMWIMGGYSTTHLHDIWYSSDGVTWTLGTGAADWSVRYWHTSVVYNDKVWILGGNNGGYLNDVWYSDSESTSNLYQYNIESFSNSSTIYLYFNNPNATAVTITGIETNESFSGTVSTTETVSTSTITEYQAQKSHTGNVVAMSLPEAGDYIGVSTDSYIYHQQITESGFGSTYSANTIGTSYDVATSDSGAYSVEGRSTNADIYTQIASKTGTYSTGGNVLHTTIAQANSLWSAAGSADGKVYIFSKEDSSSWYLDNSTSSGDSILDLVMSWRGEYIAIARNSGLQYFETASSTEEPTPTPTATTGSEVWFTVYVMKNGQPYLYQPVTVSQYTNSTYTEIYSGQTDSEGKYVCQLSAGQRYRFNINDEKSETFEIQSTNLYQVINILTSSVTATTEFSARYNATTEKIEFEYYDYKDGGDHTGQLRLKIYRTDTWEQTGNYLYDYDDPFAWIPDYEIQDFARFTMVQGVVNEIPVPDPNTNYKIEMEAYRSDGGTVKNHFFIATGSQIINLPIDSTISNVLFSCFLILLGGLFGYASSARGALVVAFSAAFFVYIGWLSIPWYWVIIAIMIAILAGFAKRRI